MVLLRVRLGLISNKAAVEAETPRSLSKPRPGGHLSVQSADPRCHSLLLEFQCGSTVTWLHDNGGQLLFVPIFLSSFSVETLGPGTPRPRQVGTCLYPLIWAKKAPDLGL